jgi:hypothetical protein
MILSISIFVSRSVMADNIYDNTLLKVVEVKSSDDIMMVANTEAPVMVYISFAAINGLQENTIANIFFEYISDEFTQPIIQTVELYDKNACPLAIDINHPVSRPAYTKLLQNYPNPFNPETWIPFQLSQEADVSVSIYDVSGRLIRSLSLGHKPAGIYVDKNKAVYWDGRNKSGESVASGTYFYTIHAGNYTATRKMTVTK